MGYRVASAAEHDQPVRQRTDPFDFDVIIIEVMHFQACDPLTAKERTKVPSAGPAPRAPNQQRCSLPSRGDTAAGARRSLVLRIEPTGGSIQFDRHSIENGPRVHST